MKLEKLTPEQEQILENNKERFVKLFLNNEPINMPIAEKVIKFVYSLIDLPMPKIHISGDPLAAQVLANKLMGTTKVPYDFGSYLTIYWASFYAYYETYVDFGIITKENSPEYFELRDFINSNIFLTIEFDTDIILVPKPKFINRENDDMHDLNGPAIEWENGYKQYYYKGVNIADDLFAKLLKQEYTFEEWTKEENEEVKAVVLAYYEDKFGGEFVFRFLSEHLAEIDSYVDKKDPKYLEGTTGGMNIGVYTLFKGTVNDTDIAYVRCYCPSTDRMFFLGVHPDFTNAKDAIASLCQIPAKLKDKLVSISRQGEIFSFNFDDKGTNLLKQNKLTQEDFQNVVSLKGDEYFKKIKFEY